MKDNQVYISVIIPVFNVAAHIEYFYSRLSAALIKTDRNFETIFVNDGSTDDTLKRLLRIGKRDSGVKIVDLSSNFGQHRAVDKGIAEARGEVLIIMDDDQEYALEYMPIFLQRIAGGDDLVLGWRYSRDIPIWRKAGSWVTNLMLSVVIRKRVHDLGGIKVFGSQAARLLHSCDSFLGAIKYFRNLRISEIKINDYSRRYSQYNLEKLLLLFFQVVSALLSRRPQKSRKNSRNNAQ